MKEQIININKKEDGRIQYLSEVLPVIPSNTILCKTLPGLGATYGELKAKRNSIIIEPNKPVIHGKCNDPKHKDDNLFRVHDKVDTDKIMEYIEECLDKGKFHKVLTTPESFPKVLEAFEAMDIDPRFNCTLFLDECHKIVKDNDYRKQITLPMDYFFECENKVLVSATPVEFTDPRFEQQGFNVISIKPTFDCQIPLELHMTNNVLQTIKEVLPTLNGKVFIFCNSTNMIYSLMIALDKMDESAVFCSENSVKKLRNNMEKDFKYAYENWDIRKMGQINWLTSRFYNAVDIVLDDKPNVILLTDCYHAEFTTFDPFTDSIQCFGRFRNGVASAIHISNYNKNLTVRVKEEVRGFMRGLESAQKQLSVLKDTSPTKEQKDAWDSIIAMSPYNNYLTYGRKDYFKIDNYVDDEVAKGYYNNAHTLIHAYKESKMFKVHEIHYAYKYGEHERLKISTAKGIKEKQKAIVEQLELLGECQTEMDFEVKRELIEANAFIVEAYDTVGKAVIEKNKYRRKAIKEAVIMKRYHDKATGTEAMELIKNSFKENTWYADSYIKKEINRIFKQLGVDYPKAVTSYTIGDFFTYTQKNKKDKKGKMLNKCKI